MAICKDDGHGLDGTKPIPTPGELPRIENEDGSLRIGKPITPEDEYFTGNCPTCGQHYHSTEQSQLDRIEANQKTLISMVLALSKHAGYPGKASVYNMTGVDCEVPPGAS